MEASSGPSSSDDELITPAVEEPARYEFQSFLSDDEDMHDDVPDPLVAEELSESQDPPKPPLSPMHTIPHPDVPQPSIDPPEGFVPLNDNASGFSNGAIHSFTGRVSAGSITESTSDIYGRNVRIVDIEVRLPWLSPTQRSTFKYVEVLDDEVAPEIEYYSPRRLRKRPKASDDEYRLSGLVGFGQDDGRKRKRRRDDDDFFGNDDDEDEVDEQSADEDDFDGIRTRRTLRRNRVIDSYYPSTRMNSRAGSQFDSAEIGADAQSTKTGRNRQRLRLRSELKAPTSFQDEKDELQDSDHGKDPDFSFIQSDILKPKKRKKLRGGPPAPNRTRGDSSDIEFEARRSSRANKNIQNMTVSYEEDDGIYYLEDEKSPGPPRIMSVKEIFQPVSAEFKEVHRDICDTCQLGEMPNKGPLVPCQGCSVVQHKACLNSRSLREQRVTKVDIDSFVMQCRFCLCVHLKKDPRAPRQDTCQKCHMKGDSCTPFSERKTPKQEEQLRLKNDGIDPITPVPKHLLNNPLNPLFRCCQCQRAWHYEHLPHPNTSRDPSIDDPLNLRKHRLQEYQVDWTCKDCRETEEMRIDRIVAWRPISRDIYTKGQTIEDFTEDQIEYLIKWADKSYHHCIWMPGAWAHGIMKAAMRKSFIRRTLGEMADDEELQKEDSKDSLLRWNEKDAIIDVWIMPDIILDVHYASQTKEQSSKYAKMSREQKMAYDLDRVLHVIKIYVKFEGLGYDDVVWDNPPDPQSPMWDAFLDAYHEYLVGKHFQSEAPKVMRERLEEFRTKDFAKEIEVKEQPKGLKRGTLMEYQLEGLNWMLHRLHHGENAILADEMGLGKTVQVVALLSSVIQDNPKVWPFLIVVPNATCANWRREIKKWAPDLRVVAYYGGKVSQSLAREYELFPNRSSHMKAHVVIMSYDSIKDSEIKSKFNGVNWAGLVVDEAQALKNDEATLYKALKQFRVPFKLLLTGTPLQNNKRELFNLLQFVDPKIDATELDQRFETITKENLPELHNMIRPYFLRRTKAGVLTFLPPMTQIIIPVSMSVVQERLCKSIMAKNPDLIRSIFAQGKLKKNSRGPLSNILMQLRKCLCHPFVYSQAVEDRTLDPVLARRNLIEASSKLVLLEIMLPKLKERGHRVLMFSQFLEELTILEDFLMALELKYERLDGSQSSLEKQKRIDAFNAPDSKIFAMLLSTRAGGVGINLATADTVIILDPDWNPHQDIQALSRAHRIGQKKKVLCFQLMTVDSAEEKIVQIGRKKMALDHLLIESMDEKEGENVNDVESVLKHGAAALFGEGEKKEAIKYDEAAVEKLLDRSVQEETGDNNADAQKAPESAFAFARVWTQEKGGELADELETEERAINTSVWDSILKQREAEAQEEAERNREVLGRGGRRRRTTNYTSQKFDFEDGQDVQDVAMDSDQTSADEEFLAAGDSDGDSSASEGPLTAGEFTNGTNSRKMQTKNGQDSQITSNTPRHADTPGVQHPDVCKGRETPRPPVDTGNVVGSQTASINDGSGKVTSVSIEVAVFKRKRGRPPKAKPDLGKGAEDANQRRQGQTGTNEVNSGQQASSHPQTIVYISGVGTDTDPPSRQPTHRPLLNPLGSTLGVPFRPNAAGPSGEHRVQKPQPVVSTEACLVCCFLHPSDWNCPEMRNEIQLRIALDKLRTMPNLTPEVRREKKLFLTDKIVQLRKRQNLAAVQAQLGGP